MPTRVPLAHALDAEVARKFGHDLLILARPTRRLPSAVATMYHVIGGPAA